MTSVAPVDHPARQMPMVGTAYLRASPEPSLSSRSVRWSRRATNLLVEAMKTFNENRRAEAGKVVEIFVEDGSPVEYDQPLLVVE